MAELLRRNFDVYLTLVDDQQIDCVIRLDGRPPVYLDVQIKARSKKAKHPGTFAALEVRKPRSNFFFIFYSEPIDTYWVVPSLELVKKAYRNKSGENVGKYRVDVASVLRDGTVRPLPRWLEYKDSFELLQSVKSTRKKKRR